MMTAGIQRRSEPPRGMPSMSRCWWFVGTVAILASLGLPTILLQQASIRKCQLLFTHTHTNPNQVLEVFCSRRSFVPNIVKSLCEQASCVCDLLAHRHSRSASALLKTKSSNSTTSSWDAVRVHPSIPNTDMPMVNRRKKNTVPNLPLRRVLWIQVHPTLIEKDRRPFGIPTWHFSLF